MSPVSRGRKPKRTKRHPRRQHSAGHVQFPAALVEAMRATAADLARTTDPLEAEALASTIASTWYGQPLIDADPEEVLGHGMLEAVARRRTPDSLAFASALSAVTTGTLHERAAAVAHDLHATGVPAPGWWEAIGTATVTRCLRSTEPSADATAVLVLFRYDEEPEHCLSVLIDHNLGGIAKDAWVTPAGTDVIDAYQQAQEDGARLDVIPAALARALVENAFERTDYALPYSPPVSDELRQHRALVRVRMASLPAPTSPPARKPLSRRKVSTLVESFLQSAEAREAQLSAEALTDAAQLIADYGNGVDVGQPLRVSAVKAELLLTDWLPRFSYLEEREGDGMVRALEAWYRWSADQTDLPANVLDAALDAVASHGPALADALAVGPPDDEDLLDEEEALLDVWARTEILSRRTFAVPSPEGDGWFDRSDPEDRAALIEAAHPDYEDALVEDVDEVDGVNPKLHIASHVIIAEQLWAGEPAEVWATSQRLLLRYDDVHEVHHMLAGAMMESLHLPLAERKPFDVQAFEARLRALPGSWEAARG